METFIAKIQEQNRIAIPLNYIEALKLKQGEMVRISIDRIEPDDIDITCESCGTIMSKKMEVDEAKKKVITYTCPSCKSQLKGKFRRKKV